MQICKATIIMQNTHTKGIDGICMRYACLLSIYIFVYLIVVYICHLILPLNMKEINRYSGIYIIINQCINQHVPIFKSHYGSSVFTVDFYDYSDHSSLSTSRSSADWKIPLFAGGLESIHGLPPTGLASSVGL